MNSGLVITILIIVLLVGGVVAVAVLGGDSKQEAAGENRFPAGLSFQDYEGNTVSLADFEGPLVVNSWAVWCPFCKEELKDFAQLQEELAGQITVISIDRAESLEKAKGFTDSEGVTNRLVFLLDPRDSFYRAIGGFSMPETLFVDANGVVQDHKRGPMDLQEMRQRAQKIL